MRIAAPLDDAALGGRIVTLLQRQPEITGLPAVSGIRRVFGGNARRAWAFEAQWQAGGEARHVPCILLSQVPGGHVESDLTNEYRILKAITGHGIRAPAAIAVDSEGDVTGAPALILERVDGVADAVGFLNPADPAISRALSFELAEITADLHSFDWKAAGLIALDTDTPLRQIEQWESRYLNNRLAPHPPLTYLFGWLKEHLPKPRRLSLVHGDLRPGNFLYQSDRITALLDWEMAHIGDPAEDIAWIYRALWSPETFLSIEAFVNLYQARSGIVLDPRDVVYYRIFSEVKFATLSVIASASFATGKTANVRHADRASKIPAALTQCFVWIGQQDWKSSDVAA